MSQPTLAELVEKYQSKLKNFIRGKVSTNEDAEDITQEVFYQLAVADNLVRPVEHVSGWLYTVARNKITDWWRKKKDVTELPADDMMEDINEVLFSESTTVEDEYIKDMLWAALEDALAELPPEQREAFEMTEFHGISNKELSEVTGVPVNTLISRKRYAVLHLRERLKDFL